MIFVLNLLGEIGYAHEKDKNNVMQRILNTTLVVRKISAIVYNLKNAQDY